MAYISHFRAIEFFYPTALNPLKTIFQFYEYGRFTSFRIYIMIFTCIVLSYNVLSLMNTSEVYISISLSEKIDTSHTTYIRILFNFSTFFLRWKLFFYLLCFLIYNSFHTTQCLIIKHLFTHPHIFNFILDLSF